MENKECKTHGMTMHTPRKDRVGQFRCKQCSIDNVNASRKRRKQRGVEYKGGSCERCGYSKCNEALEFHHLNKKNFNISGSGLNKPWRDIKNELDLCILLCANCHREEHSK